MSLRTARPVLQWLWLSQGLSVLEAAKPGGERLFYKKMLLRVELWTVGGVGA